MRRLKPKNTHVLFFVRRSWFDKLTTNGKARQAHERKGTLKTISQKVPKPVRAHRLRLPTNAV